MRQSFSVLFLLPLVASLFGCGESAVTSNRAGQATLLAQVELAPTDGLKFIFGGISGLDYHRDTDTFFAISDDQSEQGPARFYRFKLTTNFQIAELEEFLLTDTKGEAFTLKNVDAEAIRYHPQGQIIWSSELGQNGAGVYLTDLETKTTSLIELPQYIYNGPGQKRGARTNKFIEGITYTPDYKFIVFAIEGPLQQDGELPDINRGAQCRLLVFDADTLSPVAEYIYELDPVPQPAEAEPMLHDNGVSEILALDNNRILVLERSGKHIGNYDFGYDNRIYIARLDKATNVIGVESIRGQVGNEFNAAQKERLFSIGDYVGNDQENFEGMSFGPVIDGRPSLYLVSDDNFHPNHVTQLMIFTLGNEFKGMNQ